MAIVSYVDIGSMFKQDGNEGEFVFLGGQMKRSLSVLVFCRWINAGLAEDATEKDILLHRTHRVMQRIATVPIDRIHVGLNQGMQLK